MDTEWTPHSKHWNEKPSLLCHFILHLSVALIGIRIASPEPLYMLWGQVATRK